VLVEVGGPETPPNPPMVDSAPEPPAELRALEGFLAGALRREVPIADDPALAEATRAHVAGNDRLTPAEQADLYRVQFWLRHIEALTEDYPGLRALVGDEVFDGLVRAYLVAHPPRTHSLRDLGADLVTFAEGWPGFPPERRAAALDVLRYEHAFIDLFDGADAPPLDGSKLQGLSEDAWERARIVLHPLLALLKLDHPAHRYRLAVVAVDGSTSPEAPPLPERTPVSLVLYRHDLTIQYEEIEPEALALLEALATGEPLVAACDRVAASLEPAAAEALGGKVGPWFQQWTAQGWIVDVVV
jgi:Putative DNA-binding domain